MYFDGNNQEDSEDLLHAGCDRPLNELKRDDCSYSREVSWKHDVLNHNQRMWHLPIISEPAQRVLAAIRDKYGTHPEALTPSQTQTGRSSRPVCSSITRRQLNFSEPALRSDGNRINNKEVFASGTLMQDQVLPNGRLNGRLASSSVSQQTGLYDRFTGRQGSPEHAEAHAYTSSNSEDERSVPDIIPITLPVRRKRTVQQAPITQYFPERKSRQECEAEKRRKTQINLGWGGNHLISVSSMTNEERSKLERHLSTAEEVACSLLFEENFSSFRPKTLPRQRQAKDGTSIIKAVAVGIALPWRAEDGQTNENRSPPTDNFKLAFVRIPLSVKDPTMLSWCKDLIANLMEYKTRKICYNAQSFVRSLLQTGFFDTRKVYRSWILLDPKVAAWLLDPDHPPQSFADLLQSVNLRNHEQNLDDKESLFCQDIAMLGPLMMALYNRLKASNLWKLFSGLESQLCPILAGMDTQKIGIDVRVLLDASDILKKKANIVEAEAHKLAGHPFLINSPQQLRQVLFDELKLDKKCTKKLARTSVMKQKSTSEAVLIHLQEFHPLPKIVLQFRHLVKLRSTYFDGILSHVQEGFLQTNWEQTAAATGRLSSANPNLQAVPKQPIEISGIKKQYIVGKEEDVVSIFARDAYKSREGWLFLAADFQSIELRLLAHLSEDPSLLRIFQDPGCADVFTTLTSEWLEKRSDAVEPQERERTKRIVYSVVYGVGSEKLGHTLGVSTEEAKGFMASFMGRFPGIGAFTKKCVERCRCKGYVCSILNRRRLLPNINASDFSSRSQAERQAVNFVVQGSAADLCKAAMIQVVRALNGDSAIHGRLLLQIHDELLLEVPEEEMQTVKHPKGCRFVTATHVQLFTITPRRNSTTNTGRSGFKLTQGTEETINNPNRIVKSSMESTDELCAGEVELKVSLPVSLSVGKTWGHMETCDD